MPALLASRQGDFLGLTRVVIVVVVVVVTLVLVLVVVLVLVLVIIVVVVEEAVIPALTPSLVFCLAQARIACQRCWPVVVVVVMVVVVVV